MRFPYLSAILSAVLPLALVQASLGQPLPDTIPATAGHGHNAGLTDQAGAAMGFDLSKATHRFRLTSDGGLIEVTARDPRDSLTIKQIRRHLQQTAADFSWGDFSTPRKVHGVTPPGVAVLQRLKDRVNYQYEDRSAGGAVSLSSRTPEAVAAIHQFLRFQIREHRTGDSPQLEP